MRVLSLFSGVGGFDMGLEAAGMTTVFQCEIDKHARSVLDYHWPDVPKWDDVSTLTGAYILEQTGGVDVVAWGSPCQDLSLAGKRAGLSGERSGLFHQGIRIIKELRELSNGRYPTWSVWENVVGALSSNGGADFGEVLHEMDEAGACFSEWAVLDAQYFGVPQRRRRVFVASCFDSATSESCGSPLLPVSESLRGDSAKGIETGQGVAGEVADSVGAGGESVETFAKSRRAQSNTDAETWVESDVTPTLNVFDVGDTRATTAIVEPVAYPIQDGRDMEKNQNGLGISDDGEPSYTLDQTGGQAVAYSIREDAKANNFSATEIETARALQALQPSVQSHHAQTFITQDADPVLMRQREGKPGGGKGPLISDTSLTLQAGNDQTLFQPVLAFDTQFGSNANVFEDQSPTLKASQQSPSVTQNADSPMLIDGRQVDDVRVYTEPVQTLQERMGTGGNNVPVVAQERGIIGSDIVGALMASDHKFPQQQQVHENKIILQEVQALSYDGYNQTIEEEIHRPWRIGKDSGDFIADLREPTLIVRRLTPLECERLMGWPDNHTAIGINGPVSDTQRFKMCGNGVASPVAQWIAKHLINNTESRPDTK